MDEVRAQDWWTLPIGHKEAVSICCHGNRRRLAEVYMIASRLEAHSQCEDGLGEVITMKLEHLMHGHIRDPNVPFTINS